MHPYLDYNHQKGGVGLRGIMSQSKRMHERFKVLICDDSKLMRRKLTQVLEKNFDVKVYEADNGQKAVELYESLNPGVVFMDIVMPVLDGLAALEAIKNISVDAKVIMTSSSGTKDKLRKALEAGAIDFIQKPWTEDQIRFVMEKILKE